VSGWLPTLDGGSTSCFFHVLAFSSIEAREKSWQAFGNDPEWQAAYEASRADGPIVERMESVVMFPTDYSPIRSLSQFPARAIVIEWENGISLVLLFFSL